MMLLVCAVATLCLSATSTDYDKNIHDTERIIHIIEDLEAELIDIMNLKNYYKQSWLFNYLATDYYIRLDERKIQILKDIYYFKNLLSNF